VPTPSLRSWGARLNAESFAAFSAGPKRAFVTGMKSAALFLVAVLGAAAVAHCGGAVNGGGGADSGASTGRAASRTTVGGASGASGAGESNDGGTCVNVDLSSYDKSCRQDTDCVAVVSGPICSNSYCSCPGGDVAINVSGQPRFEATVSPVLSSIPVGGRCSCGNARIPQCIAGVCTVCTGGPSDPLGCDSYGTPQDCTAAGGQCVLGGGGALCAKQGPANTCNCNPGCNPGGAICCVEWFDAGEAGSNRSASSGSGSGSVEGGEPTCVPHNGIYTCLGGSWPACISTSFGAFLSCPLGATSCMGCYEGAGYVTPCGDGGVLGVGTESTCQ